MQDVDQRSQTFARAVEMSRLYTRRARTLVLRYRPPSSRSPPNSSSPRSAILKANISVKCQAREQPEHGNFNNVAQ